MKKVPVLDGDETLYAMVDDADYDRVTAYRWRAHHAARSLTTYARGCVGNGKRMLLHRFVLDDMAGPVVDHIDGNGLNCTRANLRNVSHRENVQFGIARRAFDQWFNVG